MRVLFVIRSTATFYYNKSIIESLFKRGHVPIVLFEKEAETWTGGKYIQPLEEFKRLYSQFKYDRSYRRTDIWAKPLLWTRSLLTYRRFLVVGIEGYYLDRNAKFLFPPIAWMLDSRFKQLVQKVIKTKFTFWLCNLLEKVAGTDSLILEQIKTCNPDLVMIVAGGAGYGSFDVDYLIAAKALKKKTAVFTLSWDSLAIKALIQIQPDILLVWNEDHVREAKIHHYILEDKIKIVGAPAFDLWFENLTPSLSKDAFERKAGIPSENYIVFFGSPSTVAADDRWLINHLREALNQTGLGNICIVVRPHPGHSRIYENWEEKGIVIYPKRGHLPDSGTAAQEFYDTLYYSSATVAINTSAMAEAAIIGKPVIALLEKKYLATQEEAPHFISLRSSGALDIAKSPEEAAGIIKSIFAHNYSPKNRKRLIETYIRPRGHAGERVVKELEILMRVKTS
jgi:hypothetical protein